MSAVRPASDPASKVRATTLALVLPFVMSVAAAAGTVGPGGGATVVVGRGAVVVLRGTVVVIVVVGIVVVGTVVWGAGTALLGGTDCPHDTPATVTMAAIPTNRIRSARPMPSPIRG